MAPLKLLLRYRVSSSGQQGHESVMASLVSLGRQPGFLGPK